MNDPELNKTDDLQVLLQELSKPASLADQPHRIKVCRQALELVDPEQSGHLWGLLQAELATGLTQTGEGERAENIELALHHFHQALSVITNQHSPIHWATIQNNLAVAYKDRMQGARAENIEQAIDHYQQALKVRTRAEMPTEWAMTINNLANAYRDRVKGTRSANIEHAIDYYQQALQALSRETEPQQWATIHSNLVGAYLDRISGDRAENVERAIEHARLALEVRTFQDLPEDWATTHVELGHAFAHRVWGARAENIEQAIDHYQQALKVQTRTEMPTEWAMTINNLANAYRDRVKGTRAANIEQAVDYYQQALQAVSRETEPQLWATIHSNWAGAYLDRISGDRTENVERAIEHARLALEVRTFHNLPEDWASTQITLGNAFSVRQHAGQSQNIERSIHHYQQALRIYTQETFPEQWATVQHNLGIVYKARIQGERADNVERAIHHCERALNIRARSAFPIDWAQTQNSLGEAYRNRVLGNRSDNIEQALNHYRKALEVQTHKTLPTDWANTINNLGNAYLVRVQGDRSNNIEQAINCYKQALQVHAREGFPDDWAKTHNNLANAYAHASQSWDDNSECIELAIDHYLQALKIYTQEDFAERWATVQANLGLAYILRQRGDRSKNVQRAIHHISQSLRVQTAELFPKDHLDLQRSLGDLFLEERMWSSAIGAFQNAIDANQMLLDAAYTESGRRAEVGEAARLFSGIAYAQLKQKQFADALLSLEMGKARLLAEALTLAEIDLSILSKHEQQEVQIARRRVRQLEAQMRISREALNFRHDLALAEELRQARTMLNKVIKDMRQRHSEFMPSGLTVSELLTLIPDNGALVAPVITLEGSAIFVIPHGTRTVTGDHVLWLDEFSKVDLDALLRENDEAVCWLSAYQKWRSAQGSLTEWMGSIMDICRQLWTSLIEPIYSSLQRLGLAAGAHVLFMPQGGLGLLPLHAAWRIVDNKKRYFLDDYTVTYVPSGYALSISRRRLLQRQFQPALLAIANPTLDLPSTPIECDAVARLFTGSSIILREGEATAARLHELVKEHSVFHFSCHGYYNWQNPMQSALMLANEEPLTLGSVISNLGLSTARLVTLSACETGLVEFEKTPDEYLGFPTGFLQAGVPSVISTLWAINDLSTAMLMAQFYYLRHRASMTPVDALRQAQFWLRDTTDGEKRTFFWNSERGETWLSSTAAKAFYQALAFTEDDTRSFEHPYYWAAFTYTGS